MGQRYVPLKVLSRADRHSVTVLPPPTSTSPSPDYMLFLISSAGLLRGHLPRLLPPARVTDVGERTYVEAECSSRRSGPWQEVADASRSEWRT